MGSNVITGLLPNLYEALDVVSREMVGMIPAVSKDTSAERAALNQPILVPITQANTPVAIAPAVTPPDIGDQTIGTTTMTISQSYGAPIRWNGEQQKGMMNAGNYNSVLTDQFAQAFRAIVNMVEVNLATVGYQNASRAYGTPGTTPFGTSGDLSDAAQVAKILDDNGAPKTDRHLVLNSASVANLRGKQSLLLRANEEGSNAFRRSGQISEIPIDGFNLHNSAGLTRVTAGTGANYVTSGSTAVGVDAIALATGTGTVNAGDVLTFAVDANNKYVNNAGISAPGTISLGNPGARVVIPTGNAVTVGGSYTPNLAFSRNAIQLITRAPAMPVGMNGEWADSAEDVELITDPVSGITFQVCVYKMYKQMLIQVELAWGFAAIKPEDIAILLG
jgi:hypothetical protein